MDTMDSTNRDRIEEEVRDAVWGGESECCGAPLIWGDICSECKEHSGPAEPEEDEDA